MKTGVASRRKARRGGAPFLLVPESEVLRAQQPYTTQSMHEQQPSVNRYENPLKSAILSLAFILH
ncbi:hypothetical protein [Paraburkholderia sp.]|uniref:hypothetical protein n=1 Tax=Paraburkholderia sp. TaxID=1926495 RepID=UPI00286F22FE|nr:hypothetical protein [Paraburkholderia sp.]